MRQGNWIYLNKNNFINNLKQQKGKKKKGKRK